MTTTDPTHHHQTQPWTPQPIELWLWLSPKSLNPHSRFFSLINTDEGLSIPAPCVFTTTSRDGNSLRILLNSHGTADKKRMLSFHTLSTLEEASIACSKLNMALALSCKIVAKLVNDKIVFTLTAPNKTAESRLLKQFDVFA